MGNIKKFIVSLAVMLVCISSMKGQNSPGGYAFSATINDSLSAPVRIALDHADNIYVTDAVRKKINKYTAAGVYAGSIAFDGSPVSVAISEANKIFVGDGATGKIFRVNSTGTASVFYTGTVFPSSMVFCSDGLLYVSDSKLQRIIVLDLSGNLVRTIGTGILTCPTGITFDKKNNRIIVAEHGGIGTGFNPVVKIRIYDLAGNLITSFGSHGNADGKFYRIQGLAVGRCGEIYVPEPYQGNVSVFDENTVFLSRFGQYGDSLSQLRVPLDIAINSQDKIFITAENNGVINVYNIDYVLPTSAITCGNKTICEGTSTDIPVHFTGTAPWTFTYTVNGTNPVTVTNTSDNPYILTVSSPGNYQVTALSDAGHSGTCFSGNAVITVNNVIPASNISTGNLSFCPGQSAGISVDLTGLPPWSFTYTRDGANPQTVSDIAASPYQLNVTEAGTYQVTSLEGNGCPGVNMTGTAVVTANTAPVAAFTTGILEICDGTTGNLPVSFTGTAPWAFTYSIDDASPVTIVDITDNPYLLSVSQQGLYRITHIQDAKCSGNPATEGSMVSVRALPTAVISSGNVLVCTGDSTDIVIELTGTAPWTFTVTRDGVEPVTFSGVAASPFNYKVATPGTYQLTEVSDGFCTGTSFAGSVIVGLNPLPIVTLGPDALLCQGDSTVLDGGLFLFYAWNDGSSNRFLTAHSAGTYSVTVTDFNGCMNSASKTLTEIAAPSSAITSGDVSLCAGETTDLTVMLTGIPPWSFTYTVNGASPRTVTNVTGSPYSLNVFEPGTYRIVETVDAQCHSSVTSGAPVITVHSIPTYNFSSGNGSFCTGQSASIVIDLTGTPPWSFTCTVNGLNPVSMTGIMATPFILPVNIAGTYEITALSDIYCNGRSHAGTVVISENPLPVVNLGPDATVISGETLTLDAGTAFASYIWSDGSALHTLDVTSAGDYSVTVTGYNGCSNSDMITIAVTIPVSATIQNVTVSGTQCFNATQTITLAGKGATFVVQNGGNATLIAGSNIIFQYGSRVDSGGYMHAFITTNNTYCGGNMPPVVAMPNPVVAVNTLPDSTEHIISDVLFPGHQSNPLDRIMKLYPNPSTGLITIEINNPAQMNLRVEISDMAGRHIYSGSFNSIHVKEHLDLSNFPAGFYMVSLTSGSMVKITKLILID